MGRLVQVTVRIQGPAQINERGTGLVPGSMTERTAQAVVSKRIVERESEDKGGSREHVVFDFFVPAGTLASPYELDTYPVEVIYQSLVCSISTVVDWPGSHQKLTGYVPESR